MRTVVEYPQKYYSEQLNLSVYKKKNFLGFIYYIYCSLYLICPGYILALILALTLLNSFLIENFFLTISHISHSFFVLLKYFFGLWVSFVCLNEWPDCHFTHFQNSITCYSVIYSGAHSEPSQTRFFYQFLQKAPSQMRDRVYNMRL